MTYSVTFMEVESILNQRVVLNVYIFMTTGVQEIAAFISGRAGLLVIFLC